MNATVSQNSANRRDTRCCVSSLPVCLSRCGRLCVVALFAVFSFLVYTLLIPDSQQILLQRLDGTSAVHGPPMIRHELTHAALHGVRPARGCIVYLTASSQKDVDMLAASMNALQRYYTVDFPADIMILHEGASFDSFKRQVTLAAAGTSVRFVDVSTQMSMPARTLRAWPQWIGKGIEWMLHKRGLFSYSTMCRFYSGAAFRNPAFDTYEYIWRMDTDSTLLAPVGYNVFELMQRQRRLYGYIKLMHENIEYLEGFHATTLAYTESRHLQPIWLDHLPPSDEGHWVQVWTNFEVVSVPFLQSLEVQDYFEWMDASHGFYAHRWGDAPVRLAQLALFTNLTTSLHHFCDVEYRHGFYSNQPGNPACRAGIVADPDLTAASRGLQRR